MLDVDDNILFLTFTYIMMFNMFKFIDFFCKEKGVRFHWNILESLDEFRRKTYVSNYYSYAKTLPKPHFYIKISATTAAHNAYRKYFFLYLNDIKFIDTLIFSKKKKIKPIFKSLERLPFATPGTVN